MKKIILILVLLISTFSFAQKNDSISKDKSIVYFVRASGLGALINFTYFDGETAIGRFNGPKYMIYECQPGMHLFWARSENKSFVEADLEAGKTYLIDVVPQMGGFKAGVKLVPVDKNNYKLKKIQKLISKRDPETFTESELNELQTEMSEVIMRGNEKYNQFKEKGKEIQQLKPEMTIIPSDLIYVKTPKKIKSK